MWDSLKKSVSDYLFKNKTTSQTSFGENEEQATPLLSSNQAHFMAPQRRSFVGREEYKGDLYFDTHEEEDLFFDAQVGPLEEAACSKIEQSELQAASVPKTPESPYNKLSLENQKKLEAGDMVVGSTSTSLFSSVEPTFTAYKIMDQDESGKKLTSEKIAAFCWNAANATKILPLCTQISVLEEQGDVRTALYKFSTSSSAPSAPITREKVIKDTSFFEDKLKIKSERTMLGADCYQISFEQINPSEHLKLLKGKFQVFPHGDKVLVACEMTIEIKSTALWVLSKMAKMVSINHGIVPQTALVQLEDQLTGRISFI